MIFIAGIQPKTRYLDRNPRICPSCGSPEAYLKRVDHFVSFFFVPLFPIKRGEPFVACERCGVELADTGRPVWSEDLGGERRCPQCGRPAEMDFSFCPRCGAKLF